jgi:uncharacterized membrane protein
MAGSAAVITIAIILHVLSAVVWVGGMFFALVVLRPASFPLEAGPRLELWARTLGRFFAWVIAAIFLLLASGFTMVFAFFGGFAGAGLYIQLMMGLGVIMMLMFFHVYFAPFRRLRAAVEGGDYPQAAKQLSQIRWIVTVNLILGLVTVAIGSSGRYWG